MEDKQGRTKFIKYKDSLISVRGCKVCLSNNQLITSTGVSSIDKILGGGIPIGTSILIEEDQHGLYSDVILKLYLAEGVLCNHTLHISSAKDKPDNIIRKLPELAKKTESISVDEDKMSIAWRYQKRPAEGSTEDKEHSFDLSRTISEESVTTIKATHVNGFTLQSYTDLANSIKDTIETGNLQTAQNQQNKTVLRIAIQSLGSPLWSVSIEDRSWSLFQFLYSLKSLLRYSYSVALVTIPINLFSSSSLNMFRSVCDTVIRLESFSGSKKEKNPLYKDYHGLFHMVKQCSVNTLGAMGSESDDLAFKLGRKKFNIEKMHLPPELSETVNRSQGQQLNPCSLEF